uniref:Reverse transcriptase domain-containing protein n=1 Tax=Tanacetum cinerariifolium TaxID=118510 RepID=A0A6L2MQM6_TANCI|nr:hypothetical protein [Tanacetum cinerariifolium]
MEPEDSLIMGDEPLDTISETKSNEFIKSSVENLIPNLSESKDDSECDVPACDDFQLSLIFSLMPTTISPLIDSLLDEFAGELILLKSIPLGIDKADCDPEEEIRLIKKLLYDNSSPRPPEEFIFENYDAEIESFSPFPIPIEDSDYLMEEIDLSLTLDDSMPPGIEDDNYDSKGDILKEFLTNDSFSLFEDE